MSFERLVSQGAKSRVDGVHLWLYGSGCDFDLGTWLNRLPK